MPDPLPLPNKDSLEDSFLDDKQSGAVALTGPSLGTVPSSQGDEGVGVSLGTGRALVRKVSPISCCSPLSNKFCPFLRLPWGSLARTCPFELDNKPMLRRPCVA